MLLVVARRDLDGKLHQFAAALARGKVFDIHARDRLIEQPFELHLRPGAAHLDVGQNPVERRHVFRHAGGQHLHFAERFIYVFELLADGFERGVQPARQRFIQLFVYGHADLFELFLVALLHIEHRVRDGLRRFDVERVVVVHHFFHPAAHLADGRRHFAAVFALAAGVFHPAAAEFVRQRTLHLLQPAAELHRHVRLLLQKLFGVVAAGAPEQNEQQNNAEQQNRT